MNRKQYIIFGAIILAIFLWAEKEIKQGKSLPEKMPLCDALDAYACQVNNDWMTL